MRIPRIFCQAQFDAKKTHLLEEEASRHVGLVLRLSPHDRLILFNGDGFDYLAEIISIHAHKKNSPSIEILILEKKPVATKPVLYIHLFQAISKSEKIEWVIQKAVELGVSEITLVLTKYCSAKPQTIKIDRLKKIIISACEQSGRADIPNLNAIKNYADLFKDSNNHFEKCTNLIFNPEGKLTLNHIKNHDQYINIFIGPEGGFSDEEIRLAEQENFYTIHLGRRILRTETAPICALSAVQTLWGDFA